MANGTDSNELVEKVKMKRECMWAIQTQADGGLCDLGRTRSRTAEKPNRKRQKTAAEKPNCKRQKKALRKDDEKLDTGDDILAREDEKLASGGEICEGENVKVNVVEESEDAKSDVVDLELVTDEEPKTHVSESESLLVEKGRELKNGVVETAIDNETNAVNTESNAAAAAVDNETNAAGEESKKSEAPNKPQLKQYTRSPRKTRAKLSNSRINVVDVAAADNVPSAGCVGDLGNIKVEPRQELESDLVNSDHCMQEDLGKSETGKPLVKIEFQDSIENGDKMEGEVVEAPMRRFTRSALKANVQKMEISHDFDSDSNRIPLDTQPMKLGMKMTNKNGKKFSRLSGLLGTGILEGQSVTYIKGSKGRNPAEEGLRGVITGGGILCHCKKCNGMTVVSPPTFEFHASSTNKRPPDYIYLENGKTLRDVLTACCSSLETVEEAVLLAVGRSSVKTCKICLNCKESICKDVTKSAMLLCGSCLALKDIQPKPSVDLKPSASANPSLAVKDNFESLKLDIISKCSDTVLKTPDNVVKKSLSGSKSLGRVTKKDLGMHKLIFDEGILPDGAEVSYVYKGQILLTGYIKGSGIVCSHCEEEVSPSQFEAHAGFESRRKPYHGIFTSNGVSLHELSIRLSKTRDWSTKARDDLCQICQVGGNLMGCDNCPRVFHAECLTLPTAPTGTWYCKNCQTMFDKDVDVEHNVNAVAAGRISGVDPIEQITNRCIRIVTNFEEKLGGCAICSGHDFGQGEFGPDTVIICDQCEREYHVRCLSRRTNADLKEVPKEKWFCGAPCARVHFALQKLVAYGAQNLPSSFLNVVRRKRDEKVPQDGAVIDVKWRVLSGKMSTDDESLQLLSKALSIFHDQFSPIIDSRSGLDFIEQMLYGKAVNTQEFGGIHCAILTVNEMVVSAAIFRIFGPKVAELPLAATRADCQGQGYFQTLFSCIEKFIAFVSVPVLLLPAADEAASIWKNKFGFQTLNEKEIHEYRKSHPIMIFQGTSFLQKSIKSIKSSQYLRAGLNQK